MSISEKYISEVSMKDKPKIPIGLFIRDNNKTTAISNEYIVEIAKQYLD